MSEKPKKEISVDAEVSLSTAVEYLQAVLGGLDAGVVTVQHGDHAVTVKPESVVNLQIEAKHKKDKEHLSLSLSWRKSATAEEPTDLKVTAWEPVTEAEPLFTREDSADSEAETG
jgi:amphi-Trp domain-containing protein